MKKLLLCLLFVTIIFVFVACNNEKVLDPLPASEVKKFISVTSSSFSGYTETWDLEFNNYTLEARYFTTDGNLKRLSDNTSSSDCIVSGKYKKTHTQLNSSYNLYTYDVDFTSCVFTSFSDWENKNGFTVRLELLTDGEGIGDPSTELIAVTFTDLATTSDPVYLTGTNLQENGILSRTLILLLDDCGLDEYIYDWINVSGETSIEYYVKEEDLYSNSLMFIPYLYLYPGSSRKQTNKYDGINLLPSTTLNIEGRLYPNPEKYTGTTETNYYFSFDFEKGIASVNGKNYSDAGFIAGYSSSLVF